MRERFESALKKALGHHLSGDVPPRLAAAIPYALFPSGGRVRPRLCLHVASACGEPHPALSSAAAVALEMIHCGSLAQDDLPAFDSANLRRGRKSLHLEFGEALAILVGDALIVAAFEHLSAVAQEYPDLVGPLIGALARGTGMAGGIIAGQAWESEPEQDLDTYHRAKTGALFAAAAQMGALSAGCRDQGWARFGNLLGVAYQMADDIADQCGDDLQLGKPLGQDSALHRPNAAQRLGQQKALAVLDARILEAQAAIPDCRDREALASLVVKWARRLCPEVLSRAEDTAGQEGSLS